MMSESASESASALASESPSTGFVCMLLAGDSKSEDSFDLELFCYAMFK